MDSGGGSGGGTGGGIGDVPLDSGGGSGGGTGGGIGDVPLDSGGGSGGGTGGGIGDVPLDSGGGSGGGTGGGIGDVPLDSGGGSGGGTGGDIGDVPLDSGGGSGGGIGDVPLDSGGGSGGGIGDVPFTAHQIGAHSCGDGHAYEQAQMYTCACMRTTSRFWRHVTPPWVFLSSITHWCTTKVHRGAACNASTMRAMHNKLQNRCGHKRLLQPVAPTYETGHMLCKLPCAVCNLDTYWSQLCKDTWSHLARALAPCQAPLLVQAPWQAYLHTTARFAERSGIVGQCG